MDTSRTDMLIGRDSSQKLADSSVIIFGIGGVGSFAAEALTRAGIGKLTFVDGDIVDKSNINRQLIALSSTIGQSKAEVMRIRALDINPEADVESVQKFYTPETADEFDIRGYSYIVDAVDMVSAKLELITRAKAEGVPIISSMGAGNKMGLEPFEVSDIYKTSVCPLARIMRTELKKRGIKELKAVYSKEKPCATSRPPGSISFVPSSAGLCIAGEVIRDLIAE